MSLLADPFDARLARAGDGLLRAFNEAGVLAAADVHVARRLCALAGDEDELVALGAAFAVRGPRVGHVFADLATIRETATVEGDDGEPEAADLSALPWPDPNAWLARLAASVVVATGADAAGPLRLEGSALYLDRYWREERAVAADLRAFADAPDEPVHDAWLGAAIARLFGAVAGEPPDARQRLAAATALRRRLAVVAGGPGTGKTTTVARIVALLLEEAAARGAPAPLVGLAAPTAKAAARLQEAVHDEAVGMDVAEATRERLLALEASTLHRLLGWRRDSHSRFRHDRANRLPHDVVIVDETSMVSLWQMARLAEAVRPQARLVLVGDPGQLASIEAGAVLGDVAGPSDGVPSGATGIGASIVVLDRVHRYGEGIAAVADAIRRGDADAVVATLAAGPDGVEWIATDAAAPGAAAPAGAMPGGRAGPGATDDALDRVRDSAVAAAREVVAAAREGDAARALAALGGFRLLCAHRRGPHGVATWTERVERWLAAALAGFAPEGEWYAGRPLLVTENDYGLGLLNGDTGVVVTTEAGRLAAAFERRRRLDLFAPGRLGAVETVYAMTVHKAQGSQFATAAVVLPEPTSPLLTRELLYTAVTRARARLVLVGSEAAVRAAVARPVARASGLAARLWDPPAA